MTALSETAYAKLNLALHVRARRDDGYHEIETVFAFCEDGDVVRAEPADTITLSIDGPCAGGLDAGADNLVLRAADAVRAAAGGGQGAALHLTKNLPVASGIGGGSADAAATARLLTRMWDVAVPDAVMARLGADVPACVLSQSCVGTDLGDRVERVELGLGGMPVLLVNPGVACPTGPVFRGWDGVDRGPLVPAHWREGRNDLEPPARALVPQIGDVLRALREQAGVTLARMSGSGATCFALFDDASARDAARAAICAAHPRWWTMASALR